MFPGPHTVIGGVLNKSLLLKLYKPKYLLFIKSYTILAVKLFSRFLSIISFSLQLPTDFHCEFVTVPKENIMAFIFHTDPKI